jgi:hypothetical protein
MTIFGQVRRNGAAVGGSTVVAVYHGDELRGKGTVFSQGRHTDIFLIQVWGDTKGDALVFKVSTGSQLFTVDQGLTYQANAEVGTPADYYYIDLPSSAPGEAVEQTLTLKKGWNWVAGFLQEPLSVSAMASACSRIQSQTHEVVSDPLYGMTGPLTALLPGVGYKIKVSEYYEQTAEEIDDTLLHEMIHFLIAFRQLRDTSAHGQLFRKEMNRLNRMGRHITISARTTQYVTTPKNQRKQHLVLALEGRDGSRYLSVVHPSYRKYVERQLPLAPQIAAHYWFVSNDSFFDSFSQVRSLRARKITKEVYDKVVDKKQ